MLRRFAQNWLWSFLLCFYFLAHLFQAKRTSRYWSFSIRRTWSPSSCSFLVNLTNALKIVHLNFFPFLQILLFHSSYLARTCCRGQCSTPKNHCGRITFTRFWLRIELWANTRLFWTLLTQAARNNYIRIFSTWTTCVKGKTAGPVWQSKPVSGFINKSCSEWAHQRIRIKLGTLWRNCFHSVSDVQLLFHLSWHEWDPALFVDGSWLVIEMRLLNSSPVFLREVILIGKSQI